MKIIFQVILVLGISLLVNSNRFSKSRLTHKVHKKHNRKQDEVELIPLDVRIDKMEESIGKVDYINFETFRVLMKNRGMIPGEIQFVFNTADRTKSNKLSQIEWQSFYRVFVEPFEKCDASKKYLLTRDEFGACLESDEELKQLMLKESDAVKVFELINKDDDNLFNFADYMYLRRVNIGWGDCAGGTIMSRIQIPCGMKIVVPGLIATEQDVKMIMDIVMAFTTGKVATTDPYMRLFDFIQTSYIYYYFYAFQVPYRDGLVKKSDMKRAVDYQFVQVGLNNKVIDEIFGDQTELNLKYFSVSLIIYQQFRRFAKTDKFGLTEEEFLACLKQVSFSAAFLNQVDNIYIPTMEEYEEASKRPEVIFHQRDFLVTFLQTGYESQNKHLKDKFHKKVATSHSLQKKSAKLLKAQTLSNDKDIENQLSHLRFKSKQDDPNYDEDKQKLIYRQFEFRNKQKMRFPNFLRFFKFTWLFINYDADMNNLLTFQEVRNGIEQYDPPLALSLEETQWLQWSQDFVANPVLDEYDLKQWYSMCMFHDVFMYYKQSAFVSFITEAKLLMSLYQLGYKTTQTTLDLSKQGKDPVTQQPLYNYWTAFKSAVKEEIICQKNHVYEEVKKVVDETVK